MAGEGGGTSGLLLLWAAETQEEWDRTNLHGPSMVRLLACVSHGQGEENGHTGNFNRKSRKTPGQTELRQHQSLSREQRPASRKAGQERKLRWAQEEPPLQDMQFTHSSAILASTLQMGHPRLPIPACWLCPSVGNGNVAFTTKSSGQMQSHRESYGI